MAITNNNLDISQPTKAKLKSVLTTPLTTFDRSKKGFEDFHPNAARAITGGRPEQSLLYHALASPQVQLITAGGASSNPTDYPTLMELDVIENFIYSLVADRTDLDDTLHAVFAYQYREASRTPHLRHADFAYREVFTFGLAPSEALHNLPCEVLEFFVCNKLIERTNPMYISN